jgi:hypothetical protein
LRAGRSQRSTARGDFDARLDVQILGYALDDKPQVAGGGIALAVEHPVQRFFTQAGLSREFFETDFGIDEVPEIA